MARVCDTCHRVTCRAFLVRCVDMSPYVPDHLGCDLKVHLYGICVLLYQQASFVLWSAGSLQVEGLSGTLDSGKESRVVADPSEINPRAA